MGSRVWQHPTPAPPVWSWSQVGDAQGMAQALRRMEAAGCAPTDQTLRVLSMACEDGGVSDVSGAGQQVGCWPAGGGQ